MTSDRGQAALRQLDMLSAHLLVTVVACVEARLDVGDLFTAATIVQQYSTQARVELDAPAPVHPRCGTRHGPEEPCPTVPA